MEMYRLTRHFRRLRPMRSPGDSASESCQHHHHHQHHHHGRHQGIVTSCRQLLDRACCCQRHCPSTSLSNAFRDRLRLYRVRRTACQTACIRAFLIVLNFVFLVSNQLVFTVTNRHNTRNSSTQHYLEWGHKSVEFNPFNRHIKNPEQRIYKNLEKGNFQLAGHSPLATDIGYKQSDVVVLTRPV